MASHDDVPMTSSYMDYAEHERTYRAFTIGTRYGAMAVAAILILLAIFLL